jgi:transcriptional antiterminator NusG
MKKWYVLHVYSGQEEKIVELIKERLKGFIESKEIEEIIIPKRKTTKLTKKGKVEVERRIYPGYIIVNMIPSNEIFKALAKVPGVLKFGAKGRAPQPLKEEEKERILSYIKEGKEKTIEVPFNKGDAVKIIDGPFADFIGKVEEIYPEKERIKLMVTVFGRQTPIEVSFFQVEMI